MPSMLQAEPVSAQPPFYSTMGSHREYGPMISDFVTELPNRVNKLLHYAEVRQWSELTMQAQQLKSLAGTFGFFELTESARRLELAACHGYETRSVTCALNRLVSVSSRCTSGVPR